MTDYSDYNQQLIEEFRADRSKFEGPGARPYSCSQQLAPKAANPTQHR